ncbi:hypothetical protein C2G38_2046797 [Gigaspora rosea]|uniref:Uncharacterized protein n=1 Tax=Gigaspora rosea TaxID=44941 RepID=A0A397U809_9GLOM|nr:hypothetical protein C2G38_2046797 [Gigaspora rosea]
MTITSKSRFRSFGIKEIFQTNSHIEHANGTKEQCLDYCGKDFDPCLREIAKAMKSKTLNPLYNMKRYWKPIIIYIYGDPGTAMYICITSNGPIENLYTRLRKNNSSIDIDAFIRRVKFIIKYEGESIDENSKGTTLEEVEKVTIDLGIEGEIYQDVKTGLFYWRQSWDNIINKYSIIENIDNKTERVVTNIPKSDPGERILVSSSEKRKKNQTYQDPQEESSKTEKSCLVINKSNKKRKLSISKSEIDNSIEYDSSVSSYYSDDSEYTKRIKLKQLEIQQNYQKSLKAKENIVENNDDNFDMYEDIELDISEETIHEEFNRKNKNNSLYLGFKSICKKI